MVTETIIDELQILILFKQNTKQNKPEKKNREKHNSFQLKKQCRAVICFSKF